MLGQQEKGRAEDEVCAAQGTTSSLQREPVLGHCAGDAIPTTR